MEQIGVDPVRPAHKDDVGVGRKVFRGNELFGRRVDTPAGTGKSLLRTVVHPVVEDRVPIAQLIAQSGDLQSTMAAASDQEVRGGARYSIRIWMLPPQRLSRAPSFQFIKSNL